MSYAIKSTLRQSHMWVQIEMWYSFRRANNIQVHYHIIPAPTLDAPTIEEPSPIKTMVLPSQREMHRKEYEAREELDDDEAQVLAQNVRARLWAIFFIN